MAPKPETAPDPKASLEQEAKDRLAAASNLKAVREQDFREGYFFTAPDRPRLQNSSASSDPNAMRRDAAELNTDEARILCGDFTTEIVNGFMPPDKPWCEADEGMDLPDGIWAKVKDKAKENDAKIFKGMKASNLYSEVPKAFYPDLAIGTVAMWIDRPQASSPIKVRAIPLREVDINLGPDGDIDDRFVTRHTRNVHVRALLGEEIWAKVGEKLKKEIREKTKERTKIVWGFWRHWADVGDECWQHVVLIGKAADSLVHDVEMKGEGCCPLWIGRFNPTAESPFGDGPLLQGLPSLRQIDEMEMALQEHHDMALRPPIGFPSSSFANIEEGVETGYAYPIEPGTEGAIKPIYNVSPVTEGSYAYEDKVHKLRKLFFVDFPDQSGDTPPTATQWMDELARTQRRIGTPGLSFWRDLSQIYLRFKYLLEKAKVIEPLQIDGRAVAIMPRNPAQAAAEQQEVNMAVKAIQITGPAFPEGFKANVDDRKTMEAIYKKMRVTDLIVMRPLADVAKAVDQIAKLVAGRNPPEGADTSVGPAA